MKGRASSAVRRAFAAAADGRGKSIALDAYPTTEPATAFSKLSRALADDGDLNPPWIALDGIGEAAPDVVLAALCEAWGFAAPERLPEPEAASLERIAGEVHALREAAEQLEMRLGEVARNRRPPIAKVPARAKREVA